MPITQENPFVAVIGLDRSDQKADLHIIDPATNRRHSQSLNTSPESLTQWVHQLRQQFPVGQIAICIEQPASNLLAFLESFEFLTLFAINPVTLQKFREAFVTSRAKDDALDARYLAELTFSHHDKLTPWHPEDPQTRRLGQLVLHRRAVVDERTELTNRLQALLKQYFPQALDLCSEELWRPLSTDFLLKWPSLQAVQKARLQTLKSFYHLHGSRSQSLLQKRLDIIAQAVPLTSNLDLVNSYTLRIQLIARQLKLVVNAIASFDKDIAQAFAQHPDSHIFRSLPGAGPTFAPRLLVTMGTYRERFTSASNLQCFSGIAPVTKQSGGKHHVHRRYKCPNFVKQSFHEFAKESIFHSKWAAAYYKKQREEGCRHSIAVRALAYKWQRIIWKCWQDRVPYREDIYEAALRRSKSPLVALMAGVELGKFPVKKDANKN